MIFHWEDSAGTVAFIDSPAPIFDHLAELRARFVAASGSDRRGERALLQSLWHQQYAQWRLCSVDYYFSKASDLAEFETLAKDRLAWWEEWFSTEKRPNEPSDIQLRLLGDVAEDIAPRTWRQAASAINLIADYRPPEASNAVAGLRAARLVVTVAADLEQSARKLAASFGDGVPTQAALEFYSNISLKLDEAIKNVETFL